MLFEKEPRPLLFKGEVIILIALSALLLFGLWLEREQTEVSDSVLRLHVLANSDRAEDQALKLKVRDAVLQEAKAILPESSSVREAEKVLGKNLERLAAAGAAVVAEEGYDYPVSAGLEDIWFPTKEYEDFALPAGEYRALRIVIGEGEGQNWWCVVFPQLCMGAEGEFVETANAAGLDPELAQTLEGEYELRFWVLEKLGELKNRIFSSSP